MTQINYDTAMQRKFKAVIFDFGGVITASPFESFNRFEAEQGLPKNFIRSVNATNPDGNAWARLERSEIDAATFDGAFAAESGALGHRVSGAAVLALVAGVIRPEMVRALDTLAGAGYRLACITNNMRGARGPGMARSAQAAHDYAAVFERFEHVIESAAAGVRKPDRRIYEMMCAALDLPGEACVYLDDIGVNCKGAASVRMHAIKVLGAEQALADLSAVLDLALA
jgi:putative hydrolase of the HAD superfamily